MEEANFYHALKIDNDRCIGCTHCMKECPTGAIRIRDGKALIHKDWCVDCGECLKSCPTEAIYVEQDDFQRIFDYKCRVALMPTVFIGQFSKYTTEKEIISAVMELGFTHVFQYLLCYALRGENRRLEGSGRLLIYDQRRDKYGYPI